MPCSFVIVQGHGGGEGIHGSDPLKRRQKKTREMPKKGKSQNKVVKKIQHVSAITIKINGQNSTAKKWPDSIFKF